MRRATVTAIDSAPSHVDSKTPAAPFWRRAAPLFGPPLVALAAAWGFLAYRSPYGGLRLFNPASFARWDSGQYLRIARIGYTAEWNCVGAHLPAHMPPGEYLCGDAGWFPGYPAAIRALSWVTGLSVPTAGLVVAWACWYIVLVLMWRLLADARSVGTRWACLLLAAFFPGQIYFAALFPISLCIAGMLGCLYVALRASRPALVWVGFVAGFVATYSYITAVVLVPALLITSLIAARGRQRLRLLIPALGAAAGFVAVLLTMQITVSIWDAYFISARKYNVGAHMPLDTLITRLRPLWTSQTPHNNYLHTTASQTLLTLCLVGLVVVVSVVSAIRVRTALTTHETVQTALTTHETVQTALTTHETVRTALTTHEAVQTAPQHETVQTAPQPQRSVSDTAQPAATSRYDRFSAALLSRISPFDLTLLLMTVGTWLVPYVAGGSASTYRSEAFVIVSVPLLRRLPAWLIVIPLAAAVGVSWHLAPYFFNNRLM
jgi:hypothetical protein